MAKAKTTPDPTQTKGILVNASLELIQQLDEWVEKLNDGKEEGDPRWTRTDVIIKTLKRGIKERGSKGEEP